MQGRFRFRIAIFEKYKNCSEWIFEGFVNDINGWGINPEGNIFTCNKTILYRRNNAPNNVFRVAEPVFCTGLKDKNGKLIYEGDIVKTKFYGRCNPVQHTNCADYVNFTVIYEDGRYLFDAANQPQQPLADVVKYPEYFEVMGNIYENSELLEQKAKLHQRGK